MSVYLVVIFFVIVLNWLIDIELAHSCHCNPCNKYTVERMFSILTQISAHLWKRRLSYRGRAFVMQIYWIYTVNIWYIIKLRPDDLRGLNGRFTRLAHQIRLQPYNILKISSLMIHFHENVFVSCFPKWKLRVEEQPIHIHCVPLDIPASKWICGIICHEHGSRPDMAVNTKTIHHIWHYETIPVNQWHDRQFPPSDSAWHTAPHRVQNIGSPKGEELLEQSRDIKKSSPV